jgi:uracil-DNA glycosylase
MLTQKLLRSSLLLALIATAAACSGADDDNADDSEEAVSQKPVEKPGEYDPGPAPGSGWAELFAQTPNYRQISRDIGAKWLTPGPDGKRPFDVANEKLIADGKKPMKTFTFTNDKFRYSMGPVFYRGRLDGSARVLVVGQDPSTDEAMVHRTMVGGTGQKIQGFLNQIGITRSYLILNTFAYGIFEQVDPFTDELATKSPIAEHRAQLFEHALETNHIDLIVSVGSGAHTSVKNWLDAKHDGKLPPGIKWVKTLHPGSAAFGFDPKNPDAVSPEDNAELQKVMASFANAWKSVWDERKKNPKFCPVDAGSKKQGTKYFYSSNDIPFRDLPYGVELGIGRGGTKTERDGTTRVQFRSDNGVRLEAPDMPRPKTLPKSLSGLLMADTDISWEPSRTEPMRFDPGPSKAWVDTFLKTPTLATVTTEAGVAPATDFGTPVWYRGRINGPSSILVVGQNTGIDNVIAGRTMIGDDGQHLAHLLNNVGAGSDYVVVTAYPFVTGPTDDVAKLASSPSLAKIRAEILGKIVRENQVKAVITIGQIGKDAFTQASTGFVGPVIELPRIDEPNAFVGWNAGIDQLKNLAPSLGLTAGTFAPYASAAAFKDARRAIPREDLPYGKPMWFGTSGTLSQIASPSWLFWNAPNWIDSESPRPGAFGGPGQSVPKGVPGTPGNSG